MWLWHFPDFLSLLLLLAFHPPSSCFASFIPSFLLFLWKLSKSERQKKRKKFSFLNSQNKAAKIFFHNFVGNATRKPEFARKFHASVREQKDCLRNLESKHFYVFQSFVSERADKKKFIEFVNLELETHKPTANDTRTVWQLYVWLISQVRFPFPLLFAYWKKFKFNENQNNRNESQWFIEQDIKGNVRVSSICLHYSSCI